MNDKSAKRRLIVTISSMCVAFIAVVCSVVAIFAARNQGVQTMFRVTYKATNVAATVSANYTVGSETPVSLGSLKIEAGAQQTVYDELSTDKEIELSDTKDTVVFQYIFKNDSSSVGIKLKLVDNAAKKNVGVSYAYTTAADGTLTYAASLPEITIDPYKAANAELVTPEEGVVYVYIRVKITNIADDASYIADETNTILWSLEADVPASS